MTKIRRSRFLLVVSILALCLPAFGWDDEGHMAVAYVAYQSLTAATRARVKVLLKKNPSFKNWTKSLPAGTSTEDADRMIFMLAATWPDMIKQDASYQNDGTNGGDTPPNDSTASQNIGYKDKLRHKYWHFIDTPFSQDGTTLPPVTSPNAETEITIFRAALASNKPDALKSYDLVWLLHLVGDVHQPLHCATRVSAAKPGGDAGGNDVALCSAPCRDELHVFWDDLFGVSKAPATVVTDASELTAADPGLAGNVDTAVWIAESFQFAKTAVYVDPPIGAGLGSFTITPAYQSAAQGLAKQRIALAGARLAKILNDELK
jgi:S1/P1 nuclease